MIDDIFQEILHERLRQDSKYGEQNWPIVSAELSEYYKLLEPTVKLKCDTEYENGTLTWHEILKEEFVEAMDETTASLQREELIQMVAVGVAMIECIDRNSLL